MKKWIKLTAWLLVLVLTLQTVPVPAAAAAREPVRTESTEPVPPEPVPTEPLVAPQAMQPPVQPADVAADFAWTLVDGVLTITGNGATPNWSPFGAPWCSRRSEITSVIVEPGITALGRYAFYECTTLVSAELPDSLTTIGDIAFYKCTALTGIELPDSLTYIGGSVFHECKSLTGIVIPEGVTEICAYTFEDCSALASVELPEGLTSIGNHAFYDCSALTFVELPDSVTTIGNHAFYDCSALTFVELPDSVTAIGNQAFYGCTALASVELSDSLTTIGNGAFRGCKSLTEIKIPEGVTEICANTFQNCYALASVTLPENLNAIGDFAFRNCTSLTGIELPDSVTTIGTQVFYDCTALASVELSDSLTTIEDGVFYYCKSLTGIELPDSVTTIGAEAFYGCTSLASVELSDSLTTISDGAFSWCKSLTGIKLPDSVTTIGEDAFYNCTALTGIEIPDGVTTIGDYAFYNCTALTSAVLPDGLTTLGDSAFEDCSALALTELPDSLTTIGWKAFKNCSALTLSKLPDSLTSISESVFYNCDGLTVSELPAGLTKIRSYFFYDCDSLTEIIIPEGVTEIGVYSFFDCDSLKKVEIPASVESIHEWAFTGSSVTIYGYTGSHAAQFAVDHGYPFVALDDVPEVRLCLKNAGGAVIEDGYRLEWYQGDTLIGGGDTLQVQESGSTYTCRIILEDELLTQFYPPEDITFEANGEDMTLECVLRRIPRLTLSGKVLGDDKTGIPGTIQITQTFHGTVTRTVTLTASADGSFSAEVAAVHTALLFQAAGYRDRSLPLTLTGLAQDYPLGDVQLMKLPDARVMLQLRREDAVRPGAAASHTQLSDFEGWSFTVYNVTRNAAITDFTVQYPNLIPAEGLANPGDTLRIGAENVSAGIVCEPVELQLNELAAGSCVLSFLQAGSFVIEDIQTRKQSRVLIFDTAGVLVAGDMAYRGWRSMDLAAGTYQVVLLENTELLGGVSALAVLEEYGLTEGQDYARLDVVVEDGSVTVIDQVTIPALNESRLFYTDPSKTNITLNTNATFVGKYVLLRMEYAIREEYDTENEMVSIRLPEGLQAVGGSLTVDNRKTPFTVEDGIIRIRVDQPQAILRLYLLGRENGSFLLDAKLSFELDGTVLTQPLGSAELELAIATVKIPERTGTNEIVVSGMAVPYSTITVYDGDTPLGTAVSNAAGSWQATVDLDCPYSYGHYAISVGVAHTNLPQEIRTEEYLVIYDSAHVEALKVTMYSGKNSVVFDFRDPSVDPNYTWVGNNFTFVVELNQNDSPLIDKVYVVTSNGKKITYIECAYDSAKNVWIASHTYSGSKEAPIGLDVRITMKESEVSSIDEKMIEDIENIYKEVEAEVDRQMEEEKNQILAEAILPDFDEMPVEQVIEYLEDVQKNSESLLKDISNKKKSYMEAQGIHMEEHESGTRVSDGNIGVNIREETLDEVDEDELIRNGYTPIEIPKRGTMYIRTEGSNVEYVDPTNKYQAILEMENYTGELVSLTDTSSMLQYVDLIKEAVHPNTNWVGLTSEFKDLWVEALRNKYYNDQALEELSKKLTALKNSNADPKRIQSVQDMYDYHLRQNKLHEWELDKFNNNVRRYNIAHKVEIGLGTVSTVLSVKNLLNTVAKGKALRSVHSSLADSCKDDEDYQRLSREITVLNSSMNVAASASLVIDGVSLVATIINAPIGVGIKLAGVLVQKGAECSHNYEYNRIANEMKSLPCANIDEELGMGKNVIIDPSGYVYEAVPSNRLEGVKAEVYYQGYPLDEYGVPSEEPADILWDAENYDQVNPQYTDAEGRYHWDVPFGLWLVKYSKEGYLDTDSKDDPAANEDGYLPVPPPQLEVNVGMVSTAAPEVESLNVYSDQIQILFSQYMKLDGVRLTVISGGKTIGGRLVPVNAEFNEEQTEQFASIFNFIPNAALSGTATVTISGAVNYAGTEMAAAHTQTKPVTIRPTGFAMVQEATLLYGETLELEVQVLPAAAGAGKTLTVTSAAPGLVDVAEQTVTTDHRGIATITIIGSLPTSAEITVGLDGTELESAVLIHVKLPRSGVCEKVRASIPSGTTVDAGTELELFTDTEGAQIYYTLDGTCPCVVDSPSRILYTGPIVLNEDAFIIAYAVKEGFEDSATAGFMYTVVEKPMNPFADVQEGSFYYDPVLWAIENGITNGTSATTFGPNDQCMRAHVVTFLWRAVGSPEPTGTDNPFVDVPENAFYYKPVLWALENGITSGMDATHFGPTSYCNRAQVVTFLYRTMGNPDVAAATNPFADVAAGSFYERAVLWAVENGITNGLSATSFGPNAICNRAQIVTFLYRAFVN